MDGRTDRKDRVGETVAHRIGFGLAYRDHLIEEYQAGGPHADGGLRCEF